MALLQGWDGSVTITISGSPSTMGKVKKWSASVDFAEKTEGPFIGGDGTTEVATISKSLKGKLEAVIPVGRDAGQTALLTHALAMGEFALSLVEEGGYTVSVDTAKISGLMIDNDGADTSKITFDFKNSGTFDIEASA